LQLLPYLLLYISARYNLFNNLHIHCSILYSSFNVVSVSGGSVTCELNADVSEAQITAGLTTDPDYAFYRIF
jgi:hypothetical protein